MKVWAAWVVTVPPLTSMSLAVIAKLVSGALAPTEPPKTTLLVAPLALITSARGIVASLLTAPATLITALVPVAVMLVSVFSTTVPP